MSVDCPDLATALFISCAKVADRTSAVEIAAFTAPDQSVRFGKAAGEWPIQVTGCRRNYVGITTGVRRIATDLLPVTASPDSAERASTRSHSPDA
jgi:hypothetical protein